MTRTQAIDILRCRIDGDACKALEVLLQLAEQMKEEHWIKKKVGNDTYYYECSKCGCLSPHTECADSIIWKLSNYCPDCGCRMVGKKDG